MWTVNYS
jgi:hypothetical protein